MFIERLDRIVRISNERFDASLNPSFDRRFFNRTRVCNSILWSSKRQDFGILDRYFLSLSPLFFFFFNFTPLIYRLLITRRRYSIALSFH